MENSHNSIDEQIKSKWIKLDFDEIDYVQQNPKVLTEENVNPKSNCLTKLNELETRITNLENTLNSILDICKKIDTNLSAQTERQLNMEIRKYSLRKNKQGSVQSPIHFVPSSSRKPSLGLLSGLLRY